MTGIPVLDLILYLLGLFGMGGFIVVLINRKIDRSDKKREELEAARVKSERFASEGICVIGELAYANAIAIRDGKTNGEMKAAIQSYSSWSKRRTDFLEEQTQMRLRGEAS